MSDCSFLTKENKSYFLEEVFDILLVSRFEDVLISKTKSYDELRFAFKDATASSELFSCVYSISFRGIFRAHVVYRARIGFSGSI